MIENAKITSLKREVDDLNRDLFVFYSKVGRLPGDFNNSGKIGLLNNQACPANIFQSPYYHATNNVNPASCPFVELYLYEISTFKPDPRVAISVITGVSTNNLITYAKNYGVVPLSKIYKDFAHAYRNWNNGDTNGEQMTVNMIMTEAGTTANKKTMAVANKMEAKFDDGVLLGGNIYGYCTKSSGSVGNATNYNEAVVCSELFFLFNFR
jgi:hypothetical protein